MGGGYVRITAYFRYSNGFFYVWGQPHIFSRDCARFVSNDKYGGNRKRMGFAVISRYAIPRPIFVVWGAVCVFRDMRLAASVEIPLFSSAIFDVCKAGQLNSRPQHPQTA